MMEPAQLQRRCAKYASVLELCESDDVALLRTARRLKHVHADLQAMLDKQVARHGWTAGLTEARVVLHDMERRLRRVLLDYQSIDRSGVRQNLTIAVKKSQAALDLVQ